MKQFNFEEFKLVTNKIEYINSITDKDRVYWNWISMYQTLSESFIREFQDRVNWYCISQYQTLTEEFIFEMTLKGFIK